MYFTLVGALMFTDAGEKNNCTIAINTEHISSIETGHTLNTAQKDERYSIEMINGTTIVFDKRMNPRALDTLREALHIELI